MIRATTRLGFYSALIPVLAAGVSSANEPATVAEAAKTIDLETFPLLPGGVSKAPRRLANLGYAARGDTRGAFAFQKKTLEERGWKELPGGYVSDQSCSSTFGKDGFTVSVMTSPATGGLVDIRLMNHGNVDLSKLPVPPDWKPLYSFPTVTAYVSDNAVKDASVAISTLLTAYGWQPYGHAGDSMRFKKNAIKLSAWPSLAPAQGGKTMIQLSTELMSIDLPAPPVLLDAAYADVTKSLMLEVAMSPAALAAFYRTALAKTGWRSTTDTPVKIDFEELMIFRNDAMDIATLKVHSFEGKLRATLQQQTAAEFDETVRLAKAEDSKRKAESARYAMKAAEKAANVRGAVSINVPATATDLKWRKDEIEFKLPAGAASLAVDSIRGDLMKKEWKGNAKPLDPTAGSVIITKPNGKSVAIIYIDTGLETAKITISSTGTDLVEPKSK